MSKKQQNEPPVGGIGVKPPPPPAPPPKNHPQFTAPNRTIWTMNQKDFLDVIFIAAVGVDNVTSNDVLRNQLRGLEDLANVLYGMALKIKGLENEIAMLKKYRDSMESRG